MNIVPKLLPLGAVPGLAALWLLCTAVIAVLAQLPFTDVRGAVSAVPFALLFYLLSEPLEAIFDYWYGWSEREGTRLDKGKSALLPSGRDLNDARQAAIRALPAPKGARYHGEGVYQRAAELIQQRSKAEWLEVTAFSVLNKLCRGLVVVSLFIVVGAGFLLLFHEQLRQGAFGAGVADITVPALAAIIAVGIIFAAACFIGFVTWKWEHMVRVYRLAAQQSAQRRSRRA